MISQLPKPFLLIGDFNARNTFWHDIKANTRGNLVLDIILHQQLHILNGDTLKHYDRRTNGYSHIDLSVCIQDLESSLSWSVCVMVCAEVIIILFLLDSLTLLHKFQGKKFKYFRADWSLFSKLTTNVSSYNETKVTDFNL